MENDGIWIDPAMLTLQLPIAQEILSLVESSLLEVSDSWDCPMYNWFTPRYLHKFTQNVIYIYIYI